VSRVDAGSLEITGPFLVWRSRCSRRQAAGLGGRRLRWRLRSGARAAERAGSDYRKEGDSRGQGLNGSRWHGMAWPTMARAGGAEWARRSGQRSSHSRLGAEGGGSGRGARSEEQDASCILHPASCVLRRASCILVLQAFIPRFDSCTSSVVGKEAVTCASSPARSMLPDAEIFA
jgi:hypothetical protein